MGCVYQARNLLTGLSYIGKTCRPFEIRKARHLSESRGRRELYFHRALNSYGVGAFEWLILYSSDDENELFTMERHFISTLNTQRPHGYNLTKGGEGTTGFQRVPLSEETRAKMSLAQTGRRHSEDSKRKRSLALKGRRTAPLPPETKAKLSKALIGRKKTPETKAKMSSGQMGNSNALGKPFTEEHKRKISAALTGRERPAFSDEWKARLAESRRGSKRSAETRARMSASAKRRWGAAVQL